MWQHCSVHWNHSTKWNHPSPLHFSINLAFRHFSIFTYYSITSSSAIMMTQTLCSSYNNSLFRSKAILINLFICLSGILGWLGTGALALWGAAEGRGHVQPGEKMASGGPNGFPRYLWGGYQEDRNKSFTVVHDEIMTTVIIKWEFLTWNTEK